MVDQIRFFAGAARMLEGKAAGEYMAGHTSFIRREPIGVVAQVTPWNYPMMMAVWKFAPGDRRRQHRRAQAERHHAGDHAAAGRDRRRVPAARRAQRRLRRPRHRPGAGRAPVAQLVVDHRLGARRHGGRRAAARDLKRVHLELGGKAPVVVFDDADLAAAAEAIAVAGYFNAGQDCTAATPRARRAGHPRRLRRRARPSRRARRRRRSGRRRRRRRAVRPGQQRRPARRASPASSTGRPRTPRCTTGGAPVGRPPASSSSRPSSPACGRTTR